MPEIHPASLEWQVGGNVSLRRIADVFTQLFWQHPIQLLIAEEKLFRIFEGLLRGSIAIAIGPRRRFVDVLQGSV